MQSNLIVLKTKYKTEFTNCIEQIESKLEECVTIKRDFETFKNEAVQIGQLAVKEDVKSPSEIFWKYHPGPKRETADVTQVSAIEVPTIPTFATASLRLSTSSIKKKTAASSVRESTEF